MQIIDNSTALARVFDPPIDPTLKHLLDLRREQLGQYDDHLVIFLVVEVGDAFDVIEHALGFPLAEAPFEWVADHNGHWFEAPVIFSDDGASIVLIVPNDDGVDADLLALLRDQAVLSQELNTPVP